MTNPGDAVGTNGAYGGRTSVNAFNDNLAAYSGRGVISGWKVVPGGALNVKLGGEAGIRDVAIVENNLGQRTTLNNISTQPIEVELEEAPSAGQRIDVIVGYVNNPPDAVITDPIEIDNPSVCGLIAVTGNVSNNPTAPTESMIQAAITEDGAAGQAAYYAILATISIAAGLTTITDANITQGDSATLGSTALADGSVTSQKLAASSVTNAKIQNGSVTENKLAATTIRSLKDLKVYDVTPNSNGVLNIADSSLPNAPVNGLTFAIRPSAQVSNPQISLNGGGAIQGVVQAMVGGRSGGERNSQFTLDASSVYVVVYGFNFWRFINVFDLIRTNEIANGAVTSDKIANGAITASKIADYTITAQQINTGAITNFKLADGAVNAAKLAQTGMYSPMWNRSFAVADDTPNGWKTALGSKNGRYFNYYDTTGKFAGQPAQYGFLETIIDNANVVQNWYEQNGITKTRGGNASGWLSGGWKPVMHDGDYGLGGNAVQLAEGSDCNAIQNKTGLYKGKNLVNAPASIEFCLIQQLVYTSDYKRQIAFKIYGRDAIWTREYTKEDGWSTWARIMTTINNLDQSYPVGSHYVSHTLDTPEKVAAALGGGTWIRTAVGQVIVGYNSADTDFNANAKTGGAKTVTLTVDQIPSHSHGTRQAANFNGTTNGLWEGHKGTLYSTDQTTSTGGGQAHNNLQPYIVRYVYTRTA